MTWQYCNSHTMFASTGGGDRRCGHLPGCMSRLFQVAHQEVTPQVTHGLPLQGDQVQQIARQCQQWTGPGHP